MDNIKLRNTKKYDENCDIKDIVSDYFDRIHEGIFKLFLRHISSESLEFTNPQYVSEYYFSFNFLKVLDSVLEFSKKDNSDYLDINSDQLGFYNSSDWDLESLINDYLIFEDVIGVNNSLALNLKEYVSKFSDPIPQIFENFKFFDIIDFLKENNLLYFYMVWLYVIDLNERVFKDSKSLQEFYTYFLDEVRKESFYKFSSNPIKSHPIRYTIEKPYLSINLLPKILFSGIDLKHKNEISIFNPLCEDGDLLLECYNFIKKINPDCKIKLYGNILKNDRTSALCLSQMLFLKKTNNFVFVDEPSSIFSIDNFNQKKFDFIISDFSFLEKQDPHIIDRGIITFENLCEKCNEKVVLLNSSRFYNNIIRYYIDYRFYSSTPQTVQKDILESIIRLPVIPELKKDYVFVFNFNKTNKTKGKFLLIDEFQDSTIYHSNKIPKKILKRIIKYYNLFKGYDKGEVICNSQVNRTFSIPHLMFDKKFSLENLGVPTYCLSDLAELNFGKDSDKKYYDFFFPAFDNDFISPYVMDKPMYISRSEWNKKVFYTDDYFDEYNGIKVYSIVFKIKSDLVLKEYLYYFLNSNKGEFIISFFTRDWININDFFYLPIPVPSIEEQEKIIEVAHYMDEFFSTMDIWKNDYSNNILNYKPALESYKNFTCNIDFNENGRVKDFCKNWRIVYQGLAWPLAYSYLKATKGSNDEGTKQKNYLVLFEFLAAFNVTVLISGIKEYLTNDEEYVEIMSYLWKLYNGNKKTWHMMHFGGWTTLYKRLTEIYQDYAFSTEFDDEFLFLLSQKKYKNLFFKLKNKERNPEAHSGMRDDIDVNIKMQDLESYMSNDIFGILKIYSGFKFYYVESGTDVSPKKKSYDVFILNGPCDYPHKDKLVSDKNLDSKCLYFYNPLTDAFLKIDSDLMKFKIIPETKQYAIYTYDSINTDRNVAIYKALHSKDVIWEIPLKTDEDTYFKVSEEFLKDVLRLDNL